MVYHVHIGMPCSKSGIRLHPVEKDQVGEANVSHGPQDMDEKILPWKTEDKTILEPHLKILGSLLSERE